MTNMPAPGSRQDRLLGAFIGLAVGDALGTTIEFSQRDRVPPVTDMVGGGPFRLQPGEWTDDMTMALCLAESLIARNGFDATDLMGRFVRWHEEGHNSVTGRCFDIGNTTRASLTRFKQTGDPMAGRADPYAAGNGGIMRLSPAVIFHHQDGQKAELTARLQSATTHGSEEALDAAGVLARVLLAAIDGKDRGHVVSPSAAGITAGKVAAIARGTWKTKRRDEIESSGYVVHTLEAALWCVADTADFRSGVLRAVNLGDDADTVGAVTGQIAGALYGLSGIPASWVARLAWRDKLLETGLRLAAGPAPGGSA